MMKSTNRKKEAKKQEPYICEASRTEGKYSRKILVAEFRKTTRRYHLFLWVIRLV